MPQRSLALFLALPLCAAAARGDWNQFRGPTAQGHAAGGKLPTEWGPDKNVAWKKKVAGKGWSSPVVAAGRVYLTTAVEGDPLSLRALCLDAKTGGTVWDREVFKVPPKDAPKIHSKNSNASPTPVVDGGMLYVHFGHFGTACLKAADGSRVWGNQSLAYKPVHGNGGSLVLAGGKLFFSIDGTDKQAVVALDAKTGKVAWNVPRNANPKKAFSFSTPLLISVGGKDQLVSVGSDVVMALDPANGKEIWRMTFSGYSIVPRPVFAHGLVIFSSGYDSPVVYAVKPTGTGDVTATHVAWSLKKVGPRNASPLVVGDDVYLVSDDGLVTCVDALTGALKWDERIGGAYSASPVYANGLVYLLSEDGTGTVFKPGAGYEEVSKNKLGERALASYAADGNALFVRTLNHLYKIEAK
jgi:outer membrane protein assembly factor BamB